MRFFRQKYRSGLPLPPPGDLPDAGNEPTSLMSTCISRRLYYHLVPPGKPLINPRVKLLQSRRTLCNDMICSPLGCSVHGLLQARTLECVAISFSMATFLTQGSNLWILRLSHWQVSSLPLVPPGNPLILL